MAYPRKLLADNEQVVFELRPHWSSIFIPIVWLVLIVGAGGFLFGKVGTWLDSSSAALSVSRWAVVIVGVFLLIVLVIRPMIAWFTTQYVFTNRRLIVRTGLIARRGRDMPLSKVNDVIFDHTVVQRLLGCGTLTIESAAENGALVVAYVPNVEHVQREVYRLHDEDDAFRSARAEMYESQFRHGEVPEVLSSFGTPTGAVPAQPSEPASQGQPTQVQPTQPTGPTQPTQVQPTSPPPGPPAAPPSGYQSPPQ